MCRGSEWIKVDLHIHTKGTKKNDQFTSRSMDDFFSIFFKKAFENDVKIIGITDYYNMDNFILAQNYLNNLKTEINLTKEEKEYYNKLLLIPNIELRILPTTERSKLVNIHCLFSPNRLDELEDHFFSDLKCDNHKMTKSGIISLGKQLLGEEHNEEECYKKGIGSFYINIADLETVKNYFKDDVLIGVSNSSYDGVSGISSHENFYDVSSESLEAPKRKLYTLADFIFSGSPRDINYFLGKTNGISEVKKRCGRLKPCFHGSDAHTESKLFSPDLDRICWIKSEISFEGIKQVIQEPELRVLIQKEKPEVKKAYNIIDNISFQDHNGREVKIFLNPNLNVIIGGKSTGKSLLLKNIVSNIDSNKLINTNFNLALKFDNFKVTWADDLNSEGRSIDYIPQTYLNKILNEKNTKNSIDEIAEKIMLQNINRKKDLELFDEKIESTEEILVHLIEKYFNLEDYISNNSKKIKELGIKKAIKKEIDLLSKKLNSLQQLSGIKENEISIFKTLSDELSKISSIEQSLENDSEKIKNFLNINNFFNTNHLDEVLDFLNSKEPESYKHISQNIKKLENEMKEILKSILDKWEKTRKDKIKDKRHLENEMNSYREQLKNKEEIDKVTNSLAEENNKLKIIESLENDNQNFIQEKESISKNILKTFDTFQDLYNENFLSENWKKTFGTLKIKAKYDFKKEYWENVYMTLNGNSLRTYPHYTENEIPSLDQLKELYNLILNQHIKTKSSFSIKDVLKRIMKNPYVLKYEITDNENKIDEMSEGNRSFILLELIIYLNNNKCPILIDQPEDDLDNRSIYEGLVKFLREKKKERQIIIVTHNANIVVGADAENIIVANQHGISTENIYKRKFNYKNGGLENQNKEGEDILGKKNIQEHICEILEGGKEAFEKRKNKYNF